MCTRLSLIINLGMLLAFATVPLIIMADRDVQLVPVIFGIAALLASSTTLQRVHKTRFEPRA